MRRWLRRIIEPSAGPRVLAAVVGGKSTLVVREDTRFRELVETAHDEMIHTRVHVGDPLRSGFAYTDALHGALWLARHDRTPAALCLGAGGGIVARQLADADVTTTAVDASAAVLDLAREHFELRPSHRLAIAHADAYEFVAASASERYDVVIIDLFGAFEASPLLARPAFFEAVRRVLRPGGAIAVNAIGPLDGTGAAMHATLRAVDAVFDEHVTLPMLSDHELATGLTDNAAARNVVVLARHGPLPRALEAGPVPGYLPRLPEVLIDLKTKLAALDDARTAVLSDRALPLTPRVVGGAPRARRGWTLRAARTAR